MQQLIDNKTKSLPQHVIDVAANTKTLLRENTPTTSIKI